MAWPEVAAVMCNTWSSSLVVGSQKWELDKYFIDSGNES